MAKQPKGAKSGASPRFMAHPITLKDTERRKLLEVLEMVEHPEAPAAVDRLERLLGAYPALREHVDGAPRDAEYRSGYLATVRQTGALVKGLTGMNAYLQEELDAKFARPDKATADSDLDDLVTTLIRLRGVATNLAERHLTKGGAPVLGALDHVIDGLRVVFSDYYKGKRSPRARLGAVNPVAPHEDVERAFVRDALRFGGIPFGDRAAPPPKSERLDESKRSRKPRTRR